ncbi:hypothetical protein CC78DRAFT_573625 [Lojkania enalia]|uniref:Uncharacterized protein n=1 Tax=Lojkania enalia TaxID=147567 RepID=A0A9P4TR90_9PLEO|nr:hypothetical protein CC78DRAFT_573625 [Didymosphaeria enalia]
MDWRASLNGQVALKDTRHRKGKEPMSLTPRIANSACGLAIEVIGGSVAKDFTNSMQLGTPMNSKIINQPSSSTQCRWQEYLHVRSGGYGTFKPLESLHDTFRSSPIEKSPNLEFQEFLSQTEDSFWETPGSLTPGSWTNDFCDGSAVIGIFPLSAMPDNGVQLDSPLSNPTSDCEMSSEEIQVGSERKQLLSAMTQDLSHCDKSIINPEETVVVLEQLREEQFAKVNGKALTRLNLILAHIARTGELDQSIQQPAANLKSNGSSYNISSGLNIPRTPQYLLRRRCRQSHKAIIDHDPSVEFMAAEQHPKLFVQQLALNGSLVAECNDDEEAPIPVFHCPWVRCHQRFNNPAKLRVDMDTHMEYLCSHEDCAAQFHSRREWADHIVKPHHDLLEHSFGTSIRTER